jgi:hypothetical protein
MPGLALCCHLTLWGPRLAGLFFLVAGHVQANSELL